MRTTVALILAFAPIAAAAQTQPDAGAIASQLSRTGARQTVHDLLAANQWDALMDSIGHGGSQWIALAPALAHGTDAASSEGLGIALATALPHNPAAVLRAISRDDDSAAGLKRVCGIPFIESPPGVDEAYRKKAVRNVQRVKAPDLASTKARCLARLRS